MTIIDISSNNGAIDFPKLKVDEIFIRASLGFGDTDKSLITYANAAAANDIPVSYYHFSYPHGNIAPKEDAAKQANFFVDTINKLPAFEHLAVDLEPFNAKGLDSTYSKEDYAVWLQTFLDTVENRVNTKCLIYGYADYLNQHLPDGHAFGAYQLWIANYGHVETPPLPRGWDTWYQWQYSEKGHIEGMANPVDMSRLNESA